MNPRVKKVLSYITSERGGKSQLLVFTHPHSPEAGLQVPAGTVEQDEPPDKAVLREAREETGLANLQLIRKLGVFDYFNPETQVINERHVFHLSLTDDCAETWEWLETGGGSVQHSEGHLFAFYWTDLDVPLDLAGDQGLYLDYLAWPDGDSN